MPAGPRHQPQAQAVVGRGVDRAPHLHQRLGSEHVGLAAGDEGGVAREVLDGAPQLAGGRHRAGVVGRLAGERAGQVVHAEALLVRLLREVRRASHPQRVEDPRLHQRHPRLTAQPRDRLAEEREAEVAVVVALHRREHRAGAVVGRQQLLDRHARRTLPPRPDGLALHPRDVGQQRADRRGAVPGLGHVLGDRVVEVEQSVVAALQDEHRGERLGDRADPELRVGGGRRAGVPRPGQGSLVEHAGDERGQPAVGLVAVDDRLVVLRLHSNASMGGQAQNRLRSP